MEYQNFNKNLDHHLKSIMTQIDIEIQEDQQVNSYYLQIKQIIKKIILTEEESIAYDEFQKLNEKIQKIKQINMYYQGFNDAISLLEKSFHK